MLAFNVEVTLIYPGWWFGTFGLFSISYMGYIILPIDELHHFSRWLVYHQPVKYSIKDGKPKENTAHRPAGPSAMLPPLAAISRGSVAVWTAF